MWVGAYRSGGWGLIIGVDDCREIAGWRYEVDCIQLMMIEAFGVRAEATYS